MMAWSRFDIGCCCVQADPCGNACETSPWFDEFTEDSESFYDDFIGNSLAITGGKVYSPDIRPADVIVGKCFNVPVSFTLVEAEVEYELTTVDALFLTVTGMGLSTYIGISTSSGDLTTLRRAGGGTVLDSDAVAYTSGKLRIVLTDVGSGNIQIDRIAYNSGTPYLTHTEVVTRASLAFEEIDATDGILCGVGFAFGGGAAALTGNDECWWDNFLVDWTV